MSVIYHYTQKDNKESIEQYGLTYNKRRDGHYSYGTGSINEILQQYRPSNIQEFIDREKCVFFTYCKRNHQEYEVEFEIDTAKLDQDKLFAFSYEPVHLIWQDVVDAPFSGEYTGIPLEVNANKYWNSMLTFQEFSHLVEDKSKYELLYFGEIESNLLLK